MRYLAIILMCACVGSAALADQAPVIYNKTVIKIIPALHSPAVPKDASVGKPQKAGEQQVITARTIKTYTVAVRPQSFLAQHDFIAHQPFDDKGGMLILVDPPQVTTLQSSNVLGNVDVLFVSPDGLILKIAPNISLPALEQPVSSESVVRAFVFLKSETAKTDDIQPGDRIENPLFRSHPVILEDKPAASAPLPPK